jgi:hypothetical protein
VLAAFTRVFSSSNKTQSQASAEICSQCPRGSRSGSQKSDSNHTITVTITIATTITHHVRDISVVTIDRPTV